MLESSLSLKFRGGRAYLEERGYRGEGASELDGVDPLHARTHPRSSRPSPKNVSPRLPWSQLEEDERRAHHIAVLDTLISNGRVWTMDKEPSYHSPVVTFIASLLAWNMTSLPRGGSAARHLPFLFLSVCEQYQSPSWQISTCKTSRSSSELSGPSLYT